MLANSGDLPPNFWDEFWEGVWERFKQGIQGAVIPPSNGSLYDLGEWAALRILLATGAVAKWQTLYSKGYFLPPGVPADKTLSMPNWLRGWYVAKKSSWTHHPDHPRSRARWSTIERYAKRTSAGLYAGLAVMDQWKRDADRTDLSIIHKVLRTAPAGLLTWTATWYGSAYGGKAGMALGAAVGGMVGGKRGKMVGSGIGIVAGAVGGGLAGSLGGRSAAAELVEDIDRWEGAGWRQSRAVGL